MVLLVDGFNMGAELFVALGAVGIGAIIHGSIGFGFSLIVVPTMALIRPEAVPATLLMLALPMTIFMTLRERRSIDMTGFVWITGGRFIGTIAGVGVLIVMPKNLLSMLLGLLIITAALMSLLGASLEVRKDTQFAGGIASGVFSTAAALGGPPLALIYQQRPGPELRSTLAISFVVGLLMSLIALILAGRVREEHAVLALQLLPGLFVGLWSSRYIARFLDERWLRPAILAFAAMAGIAVVVSA